MQASVVSRQEPQERKALSAPALTLFAWAVGLLTTALILATPYLVFGYFNPTLHVVMNSVDACIAMLLAFLVYGRYVRRRRLQDLLLAEAFGIVGAIGLGLSVLVALIEGIRPLALEVWVPLTIRMLGAVLIMTAALVGDRPAPRTWRHWGHWLPWLVLTVAVVTLLALREQLPVGLDESPPEAGDRAVIDAHPVLLVAIAVNGLCLFIASFAFTRQAVQRHDDLLRWLGPAFALSAFSRVNFLLFPSLYSDWVYTGDLLRTGAYALLLVGAAREIGQYWSARARAAVLEDRRRLARELHDGVVQELGYIRSEAHSLPGGGEIRERILGASDRALDEARAAVDALGRESDEPLAFLLHRAAQQVAERYGGRVVVDLDDTVVADLQQRHALVRITREAVSNALRHGGAKTVTVRLTTADGSSHLVVHDDGRGFDVTATAHTGYGLISMRERATALPGAFDLVSSRDTGTTVGVTW